MFLFSRKIIMIELLVGRSVLDGSNAGVSSDFSWCDADVIIVKRRAKGFKVRAAIASLTPIVWLVTALTMTIIDTFIKGKEEIIGGRFIEGMSGVKGGHCV